MYDFPWGESKIEGLLCEPGERHHSGDQAVAMAPSRVDASASVDPSIVRCPHLSGVRTS